MNKRSGRDASGKFTEGNKHGTGRLPRAVEQDYLSVFSDVMSLDDWRRVVIRAVEDAQKGDAKARDWVSRYALGSTPKTLTDLAIRDTLGVTSGAEIEALAFRAKQPLLEQVMDNKSSLQRSIEIDVNDIWEE